MKNSSHLKQVPELSLKSYIEGSPEDRQFFSQSLFDSLKDFGFIIIKDHPISKSLLKDCYDASKKFFALSEDIKKQYSQFEGGQRGYTPFGKEHAKDSNFPDLKEFWHVGRDLEKGHPYLDFYPNNVWPKETPEFKEKFLSLYTGLETVGDLILEAITKPLKLERDYFAKMTKDSDNILRILHYPPLAEGTDLNCVRAAAHEDINLITILVAASESGLQLLNRDNVWLPVETDPDNLIVDSGDMLSRITNNVIPSTTHRVVNPETKNVSRYSIPYFIHPHPKATLSCLESCKNHKDNYEPDINAYDFLRQRLEEIGLINK